MASLPFLNPHGISLSLSVSSPTVKEEVEAEDNEGWNDPPPGLSFLARRQARLRTPFLLPPPLSAKGLWDETVVVRSRRIQVKISSRGEVKDTFFLCSFQILFPWIRRRRLGGLEMASRRPSYLDFIHAVSYNHFAKDNGVDYKFTTTVRNGYHLIFQGWHFEKYWVIYLFLLYLLSLAHLHVPFIFPPFLSLTMWFLC
ncbi:hypothetical protein Taro_034688 [Colocasia esculenta]|uniref:Uncharacterized protein n=1 Tax=Colocasia esculenta TaxID=4460 RepID=A0A843VYE1_COLES|nr:hypothetical protein [Colocasia esculenta]